MKINWKVRFKNKTWLATFVVAVIAFVYQLLGMFGIAPAITEDQAMQFATIAINLVAALGIIIDPTTSGTSDSEQALGYTEPK